MFVPRISTDTIALNAALARVFEFPGKSAQKTVRRAMRFIASFAYGKIARATPEALRAELAEIINPGGAPHVIKFRKNRKTGERQQVKSADRWRGTRALKVAFQINYKGIRTIENRNQVYRMVNEMVNAKVFSGGFHRWAFIKILKGVGVDSSEIRSTRNIRDTKRPLSELTLPEEWKGDLLVGMMADIADNSKDNSGSILKIPGGADAFSRAEKEYVALLNKWIEQDIAAAAKAQNLS